MAFIWSLGVCCQMKQVSSPSNVSCNKQYSLPIKHWLVKFFFYKTLDLLNIKRLDSMCLLSICCRATIKHLQIIINRITAAGRNIVLLLFMEVWCCFKVLKNLIFWRGQIGSWPILMLVCLRCSIFLFILGGPCWNGKHQ